VTSSPEEERWRAEFRAFVRDHHPDRGGDADAFVAGMARFAQSRPAPGTATDPVDDLDPRYDRPVVITTPYPLPLRLAIALIRTVRKQRAGRTVE
jgi:hypothetical protein